MISFNDIHSHFGALKAEPASAPQAYRVKELTSDVWIGIGLNEEFCVFIVGERLDAERPLVQKICTTGAWVVEKTEQTIAGTKLSFDASPEYKPLTSTVVWELLRALKNHKTGSIKDAFSQTEPLIEVLIRQSILTRSWLLGLHGELRIVRNILKHVLERGYASQLPVDVTYFWQGMAPGKRDIIIGSMALEIKTTSKNIRLHHFHGFSQIEPRNDSEELYVASLCLSQSANGQTSLGIIEEIRTFIHKIATAPPVADAAFVARLRAYGPASFSLNLNNLDELTRESLSTRYEETLTSLFYRMSDLRLPLLRRQDLQIRYEWMQEQGLECDILLQDTIPESPDNPLRQRAFLQRLEFHL
jgi:hypothetical protein